MSLRLPIIVILFASVTVLAGCMPTTTRVNSVPDGAAVYIDGELLGTTPFVHHDTVTLPMRHRVQIELEGYRTEEFYLDRAAGKMPEVLMFELRPLNRPPPPVERIEEPAATSSVLGDEPEPMLPDTEIADEQDLP